MGCARHVGTLRLTVFFPSDFGEETSGYAILALFIADVLENLCSSLLQYMGYQARPRCRRVLGPFGPFGPSSRRAFGVLGGKRGHM